MKRAAFTLTELIAVVAIIILVLGISISVVGILQHSRQRTATLSTMESLTRAVGMYLDQYATLGEENDSSDFVADPLAFLVRRPRAQGSRAFLDPNSKWIVRVTAPPAERRRLVGSPSPCGAVTIATTALQDASPATATHITGDFVKEPLFWRVCNGLTGGKPYPRLIEIRCRGGTPENVSDDLIYVRTSGADDVDFDGITYPGTGGNWRLVQPHELE